MLSYKFNLDLLLVRFKITLAEIDKMPYSVLLQIYFVVLWFKSTFNWYSLFVSYFAEVMCFFLILLPVRVLLGEPFNH